ncbi:Ribonuclease P protein component 4 [Eufriesea mexicana]|uniref:Ribonuclease P protein component 4 n=2 Tax=Eufriesea mexicana TaxID=516756 RepID=A0A310SH79_9HYME|nr:Ribonuclease P protein component 4 [Eufriesea mexicana]
MVGCAKKSVLRLGSDIKRTICKCCQSPLIPGETARVRLVSKPIKGVKWTCLTCFSIRMYPTKKGYKLWAEQPNSIVQIFNYGSKSDDKSDTTVEKKNLDIGKHMDIEKN